MVWVRLFSFACFCLGAVYGSVLIWQDGAQASVRVLADQLERRQTVTVGQVARAAAIALNALDYDHCRSDILSPALTVILYNLSGTNPAREYEKWLDEHAKAQAFLAEVKRCLPYDGNVWLRDALVTRAVAEQAASLRDELSLARRLMPYEEPQVSARLFVWKQLTPYALSVCADLARADIRSVLLYGTKRMRMALKEDGSEQFKALLAAELGDHRLADSRN